MRMAEHAMAKRAARRLAAASPGAGDVDARAVKEARTAAKASHRQQPDDLCASCAACRAAMKLDLLLFGRITSGPFFALLVKQEPEPGNRAAPGPA